MEKFNRKKRAEIYLKAAELIDKGENDFCCVAIGKQFNKIGCNTWSDGVNEVNFPEFFLYQPLRHNNVWWQEGDNQERILALLFAHQMALNP